jgi:hypothetical protein
MPPGWIVREGRREEGGDEYRLGVIAADDAAPEGDLATLCSLERVGPGMP